MIIKKLSPTDTGNECAQFTIQVVFIMRFFVAGSGNKQSIARATQQLVMDIIVFNYFIIRLPFNRFLLAWLLVCFVAS